MRGVAGRAVEESVTRRSDRKSSWKTASKVIGFLKEWK